MTAPGPGRRVVVVGASHGGPALLATILRPLAADFPVPVLVVQHIGKDGAADFARWLDGKIRLTVREAREGDEVRPGFVLVAPGGQHLAVQKPGRVVLTLDAPVHMARPSVDVLFASAAQVFGPGCLAVLLGGLGEDGASGAGEVRRCGGRTVVLDEASSQVFGMNRRAIEMGHADAVAGPDGITEAILAWACAAA